MNDSAAILRKVVTDVFAASSKAKYSFIQEDAWNHRALLGCVDGSRSAELRSNGYIFSVCVPELDVCAVLVDEDLDVVEEEAAVRSLAMVALAYLSGESRLEHRRGLFGPYVALVVAADGDSWTLQQSLVGRLVGNTRAQVERLRRTTGTRRRT